MVCIKINIFIHFSTKTYVVGTHKKHLSEVLLMSTHNICFHGEIRKISIYFDSKKVLFGSMKTCPLPLTG